MADDQAAGLLRAREAVDPGYINRLFQIESGGNPSAVTGSNRGLGQFGPAEERQYGLNDQNRADPQAQAAAVSREAQQHRAILQNALGRPPSPGELYLAHQQGVAGGPALLTADPSIPAWQAIRPFYKSDAMARLAITGNIPGNHPLRGQNADNITAGDFRDLWVNKFERRPAGAVNAAGAPMAPAQPAAAPAPALGGSDPSQWSATAAGGPSQTGAVPVDPANAAGPNDELLHTLQTLSAPAEQPQFAPPPPLTINYPTPPGLAKARALAKAMALRPVV